MTKIICSPNCGNSPKMEFLKDFNIAFSEGNLAFILKGVSDEIIWNIVGGRKIEGKDKFRAALNKMMEERVSKLYLTQILSHGKEGAVNGTIEMMNGKRYAFSDFYLFTNAKGQEIKNITSYVIEI